MYVCMYACMHACIYKYVFMYVCMYVCLRMHACMNACMFYMYIASLVHTLLMPCKHMAENKIFFYHRPIYIYIRVCMYIHRIERLGVGAGCRDQA